MSYCEALSGEPRARLCSGGGGVLLCLVVCSVEQCCSGKRGFHSMTAGLGEGGTAFLLFANSHDHFVTIPAPST